MSFTAGVLVGLAVGWGLPWALFLALRWSYRRHPDTQTGAQGRSFAEAARRLAYAFVYRWSGRCVWCRRPMVLHRPRQAVACDRAWAERLTASVYQAKGAGRG
jgi:hypothetical protein